MDSDLFEIIDPVNKEALARIAKATVRNITSGTRGVLIEGRCILTAASAIQYAPRGEPLKEQVSTLNQVFKTVDGGKLEASPEVMDFASDLALFSFHRKDLQIRMSPGALQRLDEVLLQAEPARLFQGRLPTHGFQRIWMLNQQNDWIWGTANNLCGMDRLLIVNSTEHMDRPTIGGPVVTDHGELITIVPYLEQDGFCGITGRPPLALPRWATNLHREDQDSFETFGQNVLGVSKTDTNRQIIDPGIVEALTIARRKHDWSLVDAAIQHMEKGEGLIQDNPNQNKSK